MKMCFENQVFRERHLCFVLFFFSFLFVDYLPMKNYSISHFRKYPKVLYIYVYVRSLQT